MLKSFTFFFSFLVLVRITKCDLELRILKNIDEVYTPLGLGVVEKLGTNFSLICELIAPAADEYDDQISWGKDTIEFSFKTEDDLKELALKKSKELYSFLKQSEINKSTKYFSPLKVGDAGRYFCASFKYMIFKIVYVMARDVALINDKQNLVDISFENLSCSGKMFMCISNGICINQHYVCDGKKDCRDGSDESFEQCLGDPCKDKLQCDDGRCIPRSWCCNRYYDADCPVLFRPTCCQASADSYSDYDYDVMQIKTTGTTYLFIFLCILATFFSVVLILTILSKLVIFAKKSYPAGRTNNLLNLQELPLNQRNCMDADYRARQSFIERSLNERNGNLSLVPLLLTSENIRGIDRTTYVDSPPSYTDVVNNLEVCEPPPPYTSMEFLNENQRDSS